ncbi:MAG TPA: hypothetical protein VFY03_02335 [Woeseiaceae bacterium]|nr:hypothetical protein [Woeseiaceae bacterium]
MKAVTIASVVTVIALVFALGFLFERHEYHTFDDPICESSEVLLKISFVGTYHEEAPRILQSPYTIMVKPLSYKGRSVRTFAIPEVFLVAMDEGSPGPQVRLAGYVRTFEAGDQAYFAREVFLEHRDYTMVMSAEVDGDNVELSCPVRSRYDTGWSIPFWDALMSV